MPEISSEYEATLAGMSDSDFSALVARVRPPGFTDQLRTAASKFVSGERLDAFISVANLKAFAAENGDIDEDRVAAYLTRLFGQPTTGNSSSRNGYRWGQHASALPGSPPGAAGRDEARRRNAARGYVAGAEETPAAASGVAAGSGFGSGGKAEAQRRRAARGA